MQASISQADVKALIKDCTGENACLCIPKAFIELTRSPNGRIDLEAAAILNQLVFWSDKAADGWFYKTTEEWDAELGLSYYQVNRTVKKLKALNLGVETRLRKVGRSPLVHYHLNPDVFYESIFKFLENQESRFSRNLNLRNSKIEMDFQETQKSSDDEQSVDFQETQKSNLDFQETQKTLRSDDSKTLRSESSNVDNQIPFIGTVEVLNLENPFQWIKSSDHGSSIHIARSARGRVLCGTAVHHRVPENAPVGEHEYCPACQVIYEARPKPRAQSESRKTRVDNVVLLAVGKHWQNFPDGETNASSGIIAGIIVSVWKDRLAARGITELTSEHYESIARSIEPFVRWYRDQNGKDYNLPSPHHPEKIDDAYRAFPVPGWTVPTDLVPHPDDPDKMITQVQYRKLMAEKQNYEATYGRRAS